MTLTKKAPIFDELREAAGLTVRDFCGGAHDTQQMYLHLMTGHTRWVCTACGAIVQSSES